MLDDIYVLSRTFITQKKESYRRYFIKQTPLKHRFAIILGERGIGKTTTLIQYLLDAANDQLHSDEILYIQADHFMVGRLSLYEIAESFNKLGGKIIAFDEIHKYPNWSMELKSIYDTFPDLRILASGSSALEIKKGSHDLSRRAIVYHMLGLSFREYIELKYQVKLATYPLNEIIKNHTEYALNIINLLNKQNLKVLKLFKDYLEIGYYPYFREVVEPAEFKITLEQNLHTTIESDLVAIYPQLTGNSIKKIKQLIIYIAQSVPFIPNWLKIRNITEIGDDRTLKTYFKYLEDANIIIGLSSSSTKLKGIESPEKVYLCNSNQLYAFCSVHPNIGTVRETFFINTLKYRHQINATKNVDFLIDNNYFFEIGGKSKDEIQIKDQQNSYLALDNIEHGFKNRIPLWLFGFLY